MRQVRPALGAGGKDDSQRVLGASVEAAERAGAVAKRLNALDNSAVRVVDVDDGVAQVRRQLRVTLVLGREHDARVRLGYDRIRNIFRTGIMLHTQVDPGHQVLLHEALAVEELVELDGGRLGHVLFQRRRRSRLRVVLPRHGKGLLGKLGVLKEEGRVLGRQRHV